MAAGATIIAWLLVSASGIALYSANEVAWTVTVSDADGRYLTDLDATAFAILEDDVPQQIVSVARAEERPIDLALLLDNSSSMKSSLEVAKQAAIELVRRLRPGDLAQIVTFNSTFRKVAEPTGDQATLERSIDSLRTSGSTALHNALSLMFKEQRSAVVGLTGQQRRAVFVVLSDGADTASLIMFDRLLDQARRTDVPVYSIDVAAAMRKERSDLPRLVRETAGLALVSSRPGAAPGALERSALADRIFLDLSSRYVLRYVPTNTRRDGKWRRVDVRVNVPNAVVRGRAGYFAPAAR